MKQEYYYKIKYGHPSLSILKKNNPDVEFRKRNDFIISSKPFIQDHPLVELVPCSYEEYQKANKPLINPFISSQISEENARNFVNALRKNNPNINIELSYDYLNHVGKVTCNEPFYKIKFPPFNINAFMYGLDKDGIIGISNNYFKMKNNSFYEIIEKDTDGEYRTQTFRSNYYEDISLANMKNVSSSSILNSNNISNKTDELNEKDYIKMLVNQNKSERRLKIVKINQTIESEKKLKIMNAILTGIFTVGSVASMDASEFLYLDNETIKTTLIEATKSISGVKELLGWITPATWFTMLGTINSYCSFYFHRRAQKNAEQSLKDMHDYSSESLQYDVEIQSKRR